MIDEIFDRTYQSGRTELHEGIDRALSRFAGSIDSTFRTMQAINFASPWAKAERRRRQTAGCA